jgi:streptogramin lyase
MKVDLTCNGQAAAPKGASGYAGNVYVDSKGNPWMMTQAGPGGVMGCDVATQKPIWVAHEGLAGRRGHIDLTTDVLWYGEYRADKIARFDTRTREIKRWDLEKFAAPYTASTPDTKGRVYAPSNMAEALYRLDPKTNQIVKIPWPTEFDTKKFNWESNRKTMWFTNMRTARVSRVEILD